ncbi:MAG TPA: EamA family transporter [Gaiellaceae bacterium]|nr:EamA family transporter [Gaiellaceae bacterium]
MVEPILPAGARQRGRRPLLGYGMIFLASTLFAINGTVSKVIQDAGLSSARLTEVRSTGAFAGLALVLALTNRQALRLRAREIPLLVLFGVCGLAFVQWFYFVAIHRLAIGIALLIQYLAPLLVALWARFVGHEEVRRRIWLALALALAGLALVVEIWSGIALDTRGVAASLAGALSYALYILVAEHAVATRDPISLSCYGFFFASLFWAVFQPWWTFPDGVVGRTTSLHGHLASLHLPVWALVAWLIVLGAIVPFALVVAALRHVSATRAGIAAMLEPPAATLVAFLWLGESLGLFQLLGGGLVLAAIGLAQTSR